MQLNPIIHGWTPLNAKTLVIKTHMFLSFISPCQASLSPRHDIFPCSWGRTGTWWSGRRQRRWFHTAEVMRFFQGAVDPLRFETWLQTSWQLALVRGLFLGKSCWRWRKELKECNDKYENYQ
jgi:hypothetical protein